MKAFVIVAKSLCFSELTPAAKSHNNTAMGENLRLADVHLGILACVFIAVMAFMAVR
jgi:hypothetical protein